MKENNFLGRHVLAEFYQCNHEKINDVNFIQEIMVESAKRSGATVVDDVFHEFSPWGVSGVVVIAESHLSIHTWPEHNYAAVDLFTCGQNIDPYIAFDYLKEALEAQRSDTQEVARGFHSQLGEGVTHP